MIIIISSFLNYLKSLQQKDSYKEKVLLNILKGKKVCMYIYIYNLCELTEKKYIGGAEREREFRKERV